MWLRPIECKRIDGDRIVLRAPNQYVRLWFESNYLPILLDELRLEMNRDFQVEFEVAETSAGRVEALGTRDSVPVPVAAEAAATPAAGTSSTPVGAQTAAPAEVPPEPSAEFTPPTSLNAKYIFETFVAGPSNQLAHAAARAVASPDPPKYNPLFICGGVGLGKTHLLHAIGHEIRQSRPRARVLYLSGERFMNEYIHSIRTRQMHTFRPPYREACDVLPLDDIQFIANKDSTQEEFFHTFNALYEQHRQIVLSADRKPHEIPDIADRLRTRFAW